MRNPNVVTLTLSRVHYAALQVKAAQLKCKPKNGNNPASVNALLRELATDQLNVTRKAEAPMEDKEA